MNFYWTPSTPADPNNWIKRIDFEDILFEDDSPLVFTLKLNDILLLFYKIDEKAGNTLYLAVSTNEKIIAGLRKGKVSLRSAVHQVCSWVVAADPSSVVAKIWSINGQTLPERVLPKPGVGLFFSHGVIEDEASIAKDTFVSIHFSGGRNAIGTIPLGVLKRHVDNVHKFMWQILAEPVLKSVSNVTVGMLRRGFDFPVATPRLASLHLSIQRPKLDLAEYQGTQSGSNAIDEKQVETVVTGAYKDFFSSAQEISSAVAARRFSASVAGNNSEVLKAFEPLIPRKRSFFDTLEIVGVDKSKTLSLKIDREIGATIREAYQDFLGARRSITGKIVEINAPSQTFIIETARGRQVTCRATLSNIRNRVTEFSYGQKADISGSYFKRTRRDEIFFDELKIDGVSVQ